MVKQRASGKAKVNIETGNKYVPIGSWTMEKQWTQKVELVGKDDKWQLIAVFGWLMAWHFLPVQLLSCLKLCE